MGAGKQKPRGQTGRMALILSDTLVFFGGGSVDGVDAPS